MSLTRQKRATNIYTVSLEKKTTYLLPPGEYFVGDPTYFIHDTISSTIKSGHYALPDGRGFISLKAENGVWRGSNNAFYGVESGLFGIYAVDFGDMRNYTGDGTFHTSKSDVKVDIISGGGMFINASDWSLEINMSDEPYVSHDDEGYDSVS
jgi:hypothetical protein